MKVSFKERTNAYV